MAATIAPAMSIHDEESLESRMVVNFLMSGLESMVCREVKFLHHKSVLVFAGLYQYNASHWAAGKVVCCICIVLCVIQPVVTPSLLVIKYAIINLVSCCDMIVLKITFINTWEINGKYLLIG